MGNSINIAASVTALAGISGVVFFYFYRQKRNKITLSDPKIKVPLRLIQKIKLSSDTFQYKFALPTAEHVLGLPVGKHVNFSARINGELVVRSYTPISLTTSKGFVDFIIKSYRPNGERFPNGGKMSQYLEKLALESTIDIRGPAGHIDYCNKGVFKIDEGKKGQRKQTAKYVSLIAGGTGITPMLQIASYILHVEKNKDIELRLLYANNTENDILARDEIERLAAAFPTQFKFWYTVTQAPEGWRYSVGFITEELLIGHIFPPLENSVHLICGPPPMIQYACKPNMEKMGYSNDKIFIF